LATLGDVGIFSFHETKNLISGEGGALVINRGDWSQAAEIIREKGTNRAQFFRGEVDKYTWVRPGSSYLPNELTAAVLWAQLQHHQEINARRMTVWQAYHTAFESLEHLGFLRRPHIPAECQHNAHLYYLLVNDHATQRDLIAHLKAHGVHAVFHYLPLHLSPAGQRLGRASGELPHTVSISERLIRLPLWIGMTEAMVQAVAHQVQVFFNTLQ
jgi:dTDP-4-amino-4,6-dideoxygalactose transaminase